ncbi:EamA/RhaT family transporter [Roseobacter denitrificans]|uniref:Integral membrane protein, putative n=1 Tax=Roseobacter denitrificans (strain ATCC 33942 / OCh 114) TaxID=375451 RepID=Q160Y0_ROSDO|nr:DMT family transporter [Roseobacter denitrificans]ABG33463.1 integral membrane protein, putative [Roseobacter denitrificans OCh 114]AVL52781.1 EamA/RhaT family transporter [Roseobacter denitrificans]SFG05615.1 S-adenosylmethionine uptake transporter [Roseobacter denitrificans OCh 114]
MMANMNGALLMIASMACFTLNDAFLKATNGDLPLFQLLFLRGILATVFIGFLAHGNNAWQFDIPRRDWMLIGIRSMAEVAAAFFFVTALLNMPLANATAILQMLPLMLTLGSAVFLREAVGWRRFAAIGVGFIGMLLIVRPGADGFSIWSIFALLAVVCVTVRDLSTRRMSARVPSLLVTFAASFSVLVTSGLACLFTEWAPVTPQLGGMVLAAAVFIIGGYFFSVHVMRAGDVSFIAPFRYTGLIWALVLGWLFFGDWPSPLTFLGAGLIVATGLFTFYRERQLMAAS